MTYYFAFLNEELIIESYFATFNENIEIKVPNNLTIFGMNLEEYTLAYNNPDKTYKYVLIEDPEGDYYQLQEA